MAGRLSDIHPALRPAAGEGENEQEEDDAAQDSAEPQEEVDLEQDTAELQEEVDPEQGTAEGQRSTGTYSLHRPSREHLDRLFRKLAEKDARSGEAYDTDSPTSSTDQIGHGKHDGDKVARLTRQDGCERPHVRSTYESRQALTSREGDIPIPSAEDVEAQHQEDLQRKRDESDERKRKHAIAYYRHEGRLGESSQRRQERRLQQQNSSDRLSLFRRFGQWVANNTLPQHQQDAQRRGVAESTPAGPLANAPSHAPTQVPEPSQAPQATAQNTNTPPRRSWLNRMAVVLATTPDLLSFSTHQANNNIDEQIRERIHQRRWWIPDFIPGRHQRPQTYTQIDNAPESPVLASPPPVGIQDPVTPDDARETHDAAVPSDQTRDVENAPLIQAEPSTKRKIWRRIKRGLRVFGAPRS